MRTRARLKGIREARTFTDRIRLADDTYPGTAFDGLVRDMAEAWTWTHRRDKGWLAKARCPLAKEWASRPPITRSKSDHQEQDRNTTEFYAWLGHGITDACMAGDYSCLYDLADAIKAWRRHTPTPDALRGALLTATIRKPVVTMRWLLSVLPKCGVQVTEDTPRRIRTLAPELGITIKGADGRPSNRKHHEASPACPHP